MLGAGAVYKKIRTDGISDTGSSIYHTIADSLDNKDKKRVVRGLVCAGIIGAVMTSGCLDLSSGDDTTTHIPDSDSTESSTRVEIPVKTPTEAPTETPWYIDKPGFGDAVVTDVTALDGTSVHGVMVEPIGGGGSYNLYDVDTGEMRLNHQESPHFDPYDDLQPEQADALEARYGEAKTVIMEQADTDGNGELDTVAVKYVGSKGTLEFETDVIENAGLINYLKIHLYLN